MKKVSVILFALAVAGAAYAQPHPMEINVPGNAHVSNQAGGGGSGSNLVYHTGGAVIPVAHVVCIFWGPSFNDTTSPDYNYARSLQAFRSQFGTTPEFNTITQYYQVVGGATQYIQLTNLQGAQADWFDTTTPPPRPAKPWTEPSPSCSGCQVSGFTAAQNQEHFVCHETREAVTDALGNAWYDRRLNEADDKCAWTPTPFIGTNGYGYQYEWSNANGGCVKTR